MEEIWFVEKSGRRRKGFYKRCSFCDKTFVSPILQPYDCCSINCKNKLRSLNKTVEVKCAECNKVFRKKMSHLQLSKSGLYFCNRVCKDKAQRIGGIKEIMPPHFGTSGGKELYINLIKNTKNPHCECGEKRKYLLCVHHKDGNTGNNKIENLEIVCWNCHIKRHLKLVDGEWRYSSASLTPRELLDNV